MDDLIVEAIASQGVKIFDGKNGFFENYNINLQTFNFFESISDLYYRENLHSDILALILNPSTPVIGNPKFLEAFVKTLQQTDKNFVFDVDENVCVEKEKSIIPDPINGRIDILITNKDKKQAIIIENKINNAQNQDNQPVKYMKYVDKEMHIQNYKVVYLSLTLEDLHIPDIANFDATYYDKYIKDFFNRTIKLPAIKKTKDNNTLNGDLVTFFLPECLKEYENKRNKSENDILAEVYLKQYKQLLEHLGENSYMAATQKEIIKYIYSNKDTLKGCLEIANLFSGNKSSTNLRINLLGCSVLENMSSELLKLKFTQENECYSKKMNNSIYLQIFNNREWKDFGIGFTSPKIDFTKQDINQLTNILNNLNHKDLLLEETFDCVESNKNWIYVELNIYAIEEQSVTINKLSEYLKEWLIECEEKFNKKNKTKKL